LAYKPVFEAIVFTVFDCGFRRLCSQSQSPGVPGGRIIAERYQAFRAQLPRLCREARLDESDLIWVEYTDLAWTWLKRNA
jgi:hypothetical protein